MTASQSRKSARRVSLALDRPRQSALRYPAVLSNRANTYRVRRQPAPIQAPLRPRTTSAIAPPTISHSARGTQIPITHAAPPTYPFPRFPCMGFVKEAAFQQGDRSAHLSSSVSLFDLRAVSSSRPALRLRWRAQKLSRLGRRTDLTTGSAVARPHLDSFEHDGTVGAIGMTIGGEPACGRDHSRHNLVSGGSKDPNHDAVMRIGSEAPKRRTHSPFRH